METVETDLVHKLSSVNRTIQAMRLAQERYSETFYIAEVLDRVKDLEEEVNEISRLMLRAYESQRRYLPKSTLANLEKAAERCLVRS